MLSPRRASAAASANHTAETEDALADHDTPVLKRRLIWSLVFLVILMYFSMGHMMWGWPVPAFITETTSPWLDPAAATAVVMVINQKFFISGFKSLLASGSQHGHTGVALGRHRRL